MKTAKQQVEEIRAERSLRDDIKTEMTRILHDESASDRDKIEASEILLELDKVRMNAMSELREVESKWQKE